MPLDNTFVDMLGSGKKVFHARLALQQAVNTCASASRPLMAHDTFGREGEVSQSGPPKSPPQTKETIRDDPWIEMSTTRNLDCSRLSHRGCHRDFSGTQQDHQGVRLQQHVRCGGDGCKAPTVSHTSMYYYDEPVYRFLALSLFILSVLVPKSYANL